MEIIESNSAATQPSLTTPPSPIGELLTNIEHRDLLLAVTSHLSLDEAVALAQTCHTLNVGVKEIAGPVIKYKALWGARDSKAQAHDAVIQKLQSLVQAKNVAKAGAKKAFNFALAVFSVGAMAIFIAGMMTLSGHPLGQLAMGLELGGIGIVLAGLCIGGDMALKAIKAKVLQDKIERLALQQPKLLEEALAVQEIMKKVGANLKFASP